MFGTDLTPMDGRDVKERRDLTTFVWYKKLSYPRGTAQCVMSVEILPIATQQCRNYLYDKSVNQVSVQQNRAVDTLDDLCDKL